jgi:hypothetical protein
MNFRTKIKNISPKDRKPKAKNSLKIPGLLATSADAIIKHITSKANEAASNMR